MTARQEAEVGRLRVYTISAGTTRLVSLVGELDLRGCSALEPLLGTLEGDESIGQVVIDLSEVDFIDSAGIALLVATSKTYSEASMPLQMIPSRVPEVQRLFVTCGLDQELPLAWG